MYSYYAKGKLESKLLHHRRGLAGRITANLDGVVVDKAYQIPDAELLRCLPAVEEEGFAWRFQRHQCGRPISLPAI